MLSPVCCLQCVLLPVINAFLKSARVHSEPRGSPTWFTVDAHRVLSDVPTHRLAAALPRLRRPRRCDDATPRRSLKHNTRQAPSLPAQHSSAAGRSASLVAAVARAAAPRARHTAAARLTRCGWGDPVDFSPVTVKTTGAAADGLVSMVLGERESPPPIQRALDFIHHTIRLTLPRDHSQDRVPERNVLVTLFSRGGVERL